MLTSKPKSLLRAIADLCTGAQTGQRPSTPRDPTGHRVGTIFFPAAVAESPIMIDEPMVATMTNGMATTPACNYTPDRRPSIDEMSAIFRQAWRKNTQDIFTVASICDYMDQTYNRAEKKELIEKLPIDRPRFDKLAKLGRDQRLAGIADRLPPSESTLCTLSGFADDELAAALDVGIIHPGATRATIAAWRARNRAGRTADQNPDAAAMVTYAVIRLPTNPPQELVDEINGILKPLHKFADVEVCYPLTDACLRPKVRQLVADTKAARLAHRPDHISQTDWRRQRWPYRAKEVAIGATTGFKCMRAIAERIGQGEAFAAILRDK
jgi:hypothetical protein